MLKDVQILFQVDDLRRAVQEKSDEVKDLRNRLALVSSSNGPEVVCFRSFYNSCMVVVYHLSCCP